MSASDAGTERIASFVALERRVRSLERSVDFYVRGLGFERHDSRELPDLEADALLALGEERIALFTFDGHDEVAQVAGPDIRFQHVAIVTRDMVDSFRALQVVAPVPITRGGPQRLPAASGGATAFKFRDPDGHPLELIEFTAASCPARWRVPSGGRSTLGIDHAALSVSQVGPSIRFYEDIGFRVAARQINRGPAQAKLDGLDRAEVEVVAMKLPGAPAVHLELLCYTTPPAFRAASFASPGHSTTTDRLAWASAAQSDVLVDPDGHLHHRLGPTAQQRRSSA